MSIQGEFNMPPLEYVNHNFPSNVANSIFLQNHPHQRASVPLKQPTKRSSVNSENSQSTKPASSNVYAQGMPINADDQNSV